MKIPIYFNYRFRLIVISFLIIIFLISLSILAFNEVMGKKRLIDLSGGNDDLVMDYLDKSKSLNLDKKTRYGLVEHRVLYDLEDEIFIMNEIDKLLFLLDISLSTGNNEKEYYLDELYEDYNIDDFILKLNLVLSRDYNLNLNVYEERFSNLIEDILEYVNMFPDEASFLSFNDSELISFLSEITNLKDDLIDFYMEYEVVDDVLIFDSDERSLDLR